MRNSISTLLIVCLLAAVFVSCDKDDDKSSSREVRYEITGNFSGKLLIIYNDNVNGNTMVNDATVPWSKEVNYGSNVQGIGMGGHATVVGVPGQTVMVKIYAGGKVVDSDQATAGANGELSLPALSHLF